MNIPLDEVLHFGAITSDSTGAAVDADSTPTWAVREEDTDASIQSGNFTKRTGLDGHYRASVTLSAANGFEVGKWYEVLGLATVDSIAGKSILKTFRVVAAELVAGAPVVDIGYVAGEAATAATDAEELQSTTIATLASQTSFTLTAGSADDDAYNGCMAVFIDQSTSAQRARCTISDYTGSTKTVTLAAAPEFTIATGDTVKIVAVPKQLGSVAVATGAAQTTAQNDLDILTGTDGVTLATLQPNYAPSTAAALASLVTTVGVAGVGLTEAGGTGDQLTAIPWNASWDAEVQSEVTDALNAALTEAYRSTGATGSVAQLLYEIIAHLGNSAIASTTKTLTKLDKSTTAKTFQLDDDTTPTAIEELS